MLRSAKRDWLLCFFIVCINIHPCSARERRGTFRSRRASNQIKSPSPRESWLVTRRTLSSQVTSQDGRTGDPWVFRDFYSRVTFRGLYFQYQFFGLGLNFQADRAVGKVNLKQEIKNKNERHCRHIRALSVLYVYHGDMRISAVFLFWIIRCFKYVSHCCTMNIHVLDVRWMPCVLWLLSMTHEHGWSLSHRNGCIYIISSMHKRASFKTLWIASKSSAVNQTQSNHITMKGLHV